MRALRIVSVLTLVSLGIVACLGQEQPEVGRATAAVGEAQHFTIVWKRGVPANAAEVVAAADGTLLESLDLLDASLAVSTSPTFAVDLGAHASVSAVGPQMFQSLPASGIEPQVLDADAFLPEATSNAYFYPYYQWDIRRVNAEAAWDVTTGSHDTVVAVIDTGVAWNHPDLAPNVVFATCASIYEGCNPYPSYSYHGTHVAGTVAATRVYGSTGVGPDLAIASYNVFDLHPRYGLVAFDWPLWTAMIDAADRGFQVINMSLGGILLMPAGRDHVAAWTMWNRVAEYVTRRGVTIVAAAGNEELDTRGPYAVIPGDLPSVISVAATGIAPLPEYPQDGAYDVQAFYSNYGASIDIAAPGGDYGPDDSTYEEYWHHLIFSTYVNPNPTCAATYSCRVGWSWAGGTSMAAPHVAGVAGLVLDNDPSLTPRQVKSVLQRTAQDLGDRAAFGHGMVDARAALGR